MADGNGEAPRQAAAERIDVRGQICPYPVMETRDALKKLQAGQVLEVLCDYEPAAVTTIPSFCKWKNYPPLSGVGY